VRRRVGHKRARRIAQRTTKGISVLYCFRKLELLYVYKEEKRIRDYPSEYFYTKEFIYAINYFIAQK
jgi:hypothetical protein